MLEPEIATIRDILLGMATNSDRQATQWARQIVEGLKRENYEVVFQDKQGDI